MKQLVFDTGPFLLIFTKERSSDQAREAVLRHERGELEIFIHPNNLAEAYKVISMIRDETPELLKADVKPEDVVRSAYATLRVVQDEETTVMLGMLKLKYAGKPWGDLSSAALSLRLSEEREVPTVILDHERHFDDITEVSTIRASELRQVVE